MAIEHDDVLDADGDDAVQPALCLPCPKVPSAKEVEIHNLTHLPYRSWCRHCVAARRPNSHHRTSTSHRSVPLLVADYCFLGDTDDQEKVTVLVACLYPSRSILATVVPSKGPDPQAVARLATFIKESGYSKVVYKSDQEAAIRSLFEAAFEASSREGTLYNPKLVQMVPEASSAGESQSNGKAENAIRRVEDLARTYKSALETHLDERLPATHPVFHWLVEHAGSILNRHLCNDEGDTPYQAIHGQRFKGRTAEF